MNYDEFGQCFATSDEVCELLYKNPDLDISAIQVVDAFEFNKSVSELYAPMKRLTEYRRIAESLETFDLISQSNWHMPQEYKELDIAEWVLNQCNNEHELQRVAQELLLFQDRDLFNLLRYLKYLVDTLRKHNIVWGVGRGSSVASYVLYKIGVHKIDSMFYQIDIEEFLK